jgi:hypothetical protein
VGLIFHTLKKKKKKKKKNSGLHISWGGDISLQQEDYSAKAGLEHRPLSRSGQSWIGGQATQQKWPKLEHWRRILQLEHLATKHWWPSLEFSDCDLDLLDWASQYWQNPTLPFTCMTQG